MSRTIAIWDVTLRDGEQTPGLHFSVADKVRLAVALDAIGVAAADAVFPASGDSEVEAARQLLARGLRMELSATARMSPAEVDLVADLGLPAINLMAPASDIHIEKKFATSRREICRRMTQVLGHAARRGLAVHFIAEDTSRADSAFAAELCQRAFDLGARTLVICDTVGVMVPSAMAELVAGIRRATDPAAHYAVHCHNDYGLATANTLAAVEAGVDTVTVTVNGIGERAGNAALEQVAVALPRLLKVECGIDTSRLYDLCKLMEAISGIPIAASQPVAGFNAFRHESGIHVAAMLRDAATYEALDPETVGRQREYVLGKHSGRRHLVHVLERHGLHADADQLEALLVAVKARAAAGSELRRRRFLQAVDTYCRQALGMTEQDLLDLIRDIMDQPQRAQGAAGR